MSAAILFTDGASKGNPGPSSIGVLIKTVEGITLAEISEQVGKRTNNEAEYLALIRGLEEARLLGLTDVKWVTDSELLQCQWTGRYKVKAPNLIPLLARARSLASGFRSFEASHTLRDGNKDADSLANKAFERS